MTQNLDTLRHKWRQLQTARQDVRAKALIQAEAEIQGMREEFNVLLWETIRRDGEKIQRVSDQAGISRAQIHKILKETGVNRKAIGGGHISFIKDKAWGFPRYRFSIPAYDFADVGGGVHLLEGYVTQNRDNAAQWIPTVDDPDLRDLFTAEITEPGSEWLREWRSFKESEGL